MAAVAESPDEVLARAFDFLEAEQDACLAMVDAFGGEDSVVASAMADRGLRLVRLLRQAFLLVDQPSSVQARVVRELMDDLRIDTA